MDSLNDIGLCERGFFTERELFKNIPVDLKIHHKIEEFNELQTELPTLPPNLITTRNTKMVSRYSLYFITLLQI